MWGDVGSGEARARAREGGTEGQAVGPARGVREFFFQRKFFIFLTINMMTFCYLGSLQFFYDIDLIFLFYQKALIPTFNNSFYHKITIVNSQHTSTNSTCYVLENWF